MALIGNYNVFNKTPGRYLAGTSTCDRSDFNRAGASRNCYYNDGGNFSTNGSTNPTHLLFTYAKQVGYTPPFTWNISQYGGGMAINAIGTSVIVFPLVPQQPMLASITGSGTLTASILGLGNIISALTGSSSFSATISANGNIVLSATGSGTLTANILGNGLGALSLTGSGSLSATANLFINMIAAMTGSSGFNASINSLVAMLCSMTGSSTISIDITGQQPMSASITGSGSLIGNLSAFAEMVSNLLGSGLLSGTTTATAFMSENIVVTGTGLNSANVGQYVWQSILSQFSADPNSAAAKLLASASAGDPWSTVLPGSYTSEQAGSILAQLQTYIDELHKIQGLDASNPATTTQTTLIAGDINIDITGDGINSTTFTRQ